MLHFLLPKHLSEQTAVDEFDSQHRRARPNTSTYWLFEGVRRIHRDAPIDLVLDSLDDDARLVVWSAAQINCPAANLQERLELTEARGINVFLVNPFLEITRDCKRSAEILRVIFDTQAQTLLHQRSPDGAVPAAQVSDMRRLRAGGAKVRDIAEAAGVSAATVSKYTKTFGHELPLASDEISPQVDVDERLSMLGEELKTLVARFIRSKASQHTRAAYCLHWRSFAKHAEAATGQPLRRLADVTVEVSEHYFNALVKRHGNIATSINSKLGGLKGFYKWLLLCGHSPAENPFRTCFIPTVRRSEVKTEPFTREEVSSILSKMAERAKASGLLDKRDTWTRRYVVCCIMASTGARVGAVCEMRRRDVTRRRDGLHISFADKKSGRYQVPAGRLATGALEGWLAAAPSLLRPAEERLFSYKSSVASVVASVRTGLREILDELGIERDNVGCHSFRVTFATENYAAKMSERELQQRLAHNDINQTMAYVRPTLSGAGDTWLGDLGAGAPSEVFGA